MKTILKNTIVLDMTRLLPGPFCSMILANHGARVIKIEDTEQGDYMRMWGAKNKERESGWYHILNVNKESMTLNLKKPRGIEIFKNLISKSDILLEGFRPGVMKKLGLDYANLAKINKSLIYCSISGYGQYGPYVQKAGHDINYLALNGVLSYSDCRDHPKLYGLQIADISCGLYSTIGIAMALYKRAIHPEHLGDYLDVSLFDSSFVWNCLALGDYWANDKMPKLGCTILDTGVAAYDIYETKDNQYMALGALEKKFWENFCDTIGLSECKSINHLKKGPEQAKVKGKIIAKFKEKTQDEWIKIFENKDCCCEPIYDIPTAVKNPQIKARKMIISSDENNKNNRWCMGDPIKFLSEKENYEIRNAPKKGEHNEKILKELLNLDDELIQKLRKDNII